MTEWKIRLDLAVPGTYPIYEYGENTIKNCVIVYKDFALANRIVRLLNEDQIVDETTPY